VTSHQVILVAAALAALAAFIVGLFAGCRRRLGTALVLVLAGALGMALLAAVFIVKPLLQRPMPAWQLDALYRIKAEETIRSIQAQPKYDDPKRLTRFEAIVYSQGGEDGIIQEIFRRIGTTNKVFCEFGSADGVENNTALLVTLGWNGLWMDGDGAAIERAKSRYAGAVRQGRLQIQQRFITAENVEALFGAAKLPAEMDLLSIDIDRNDYYVWARIAHYRPRVAIVEYNAMYPPGVDWVIPYDAQAWWDQRTSYWGASLSALERLARSKGYSLVGCSLTGVNAFFVRDDLLGDRFSGPYTAEHHYEPSRLYLVSYKPGFTRNPR
jgi:hypothetical protein